MPFFAQGPCGSHRGAGSGLQLPNVSDLSGVGGKGSASIPKENPFPFMGCFDTAVVDDGQPKVRDPVWTTKALKQPGWKEKKGSKNNRAGNNHRVKPLHDLESWSELTSLDQLPKTWWKPAGKQQRRIPVSDRGQDPGQVRGLPFGRLFWLQFCDRRVSRRCYQGSSQEQYPRQLLEIPSSAAGMLAKGRSCDGISKRRPYQPEACGCDRGNVP